MAAGSLIAHDVSPAISTISSGDTILSQLCEIVRKWSFHSVAKTSIGLGFANDRCKSEIA